MGMRIPWTASEDPDAFPARLASPFRPPERRQKPGRTRVFLARVLGRRSPTGFYSGPRRQYQSDGVCEAIGRARLLQMSFYAQGTVALGPAAWCGCWK